MIHEGFWYREVIKAETRKVTTSGIILYLNGTSSAGKSSLAKALQEVLEEPYLHIGIDMLLNAWTRRYLGVEAPNEHGVQWHVDEQGRIQRVVFGAYAQSVAHGLHVMAGALAREGNNVIVDDVMFAQEMVVHCANSLKNFRAYFIGVRCQRDVALQREQDRGDRFLGLVDTHFDVVHQHGIYDLEIDTSHETPQQCAERARTFLAAHRSPQAFQVLARMGI